jgi:hypothetical protein
VRFRAVSIMTEDIVFIMPQTKRPGGALGS